MVNEDYTGTLKEAFETVQDMEQNLFTQIVNVGMYGVYKEIHDVMEPGDDYEFELAMFEGTDDKALNTLLKLIKQVAEAKQQLFELVEGDEPPF
jgi:hypothetical protein